MKHSGACWNHTKKVLTGINYTGNVPRRTSFPRGLCQINLSSQSVIARCKFLFACGKLSSLRYCAQRGKCIFLTEQNNNPRNFITKSIAATNVAIVVDRSVINHAVAGSYRISRPILSPLGFPGF